MVRREAGPEPVAFLPFTERGTRPDLDLSTPLPPVFGRAKLRLPASFDPGSEPAAGTKPLPKKQMSVSSDNESDGCRDEVAARVRRRLQKARLEVDTEPTLEGLPLGDDPGNDNPKLQASEEDKKEKVPALVLYEEGDPASLQALIADTRTKPSVHRLAMKMLSDLRVYGGLRVPYFYAGHARKGRRYSSFGLQCVPKAIRRVIMPDWCKEIDIVNCIPRILLWLADSLFPDQGEELAHLRRFVQDRDAFLERLMASTDWDKQQAKKACLKLVHGGSEFVLPAQGGRRVNAYDLVPLRELRASVRSACTRLQLAYPDTWQRCQKAFAEHNRKTGETSMQGGDGKTKFYSAEGRFVHHVTTLYEACFIDRARKYFRKKKKCHTTALIHDALVVSDPRGVISTRTLQKLSKYISAGSVPAPERKKRGAKEKFPQLAAPKDLEWSLHEMKATEADLEASRLPAVDVHRTPFVNSYVHTDDSRLTKVKKANGNFEAVLNPHRLNEYRVYAVDACQGMGKSELARQAIVDLLTKTPHAKALLVTGRSTQAAVAYFELKTYLERRGLSVAGLELYNKERENGRYPYLFGAQLAVVQFESLHRLVSCPDATGLVRIPRYHLVICDEFCLICDQSVSAATNGHWLRRNDSIWRQVCRSADRLLFSDKDMHKDSRLFDFLFGEKEGICRAKLDPKTKRFVEIDLEAAQQSVFYERYVFKNPSLERKLLVIETHAGLYQDLKARLLQGQQCLVACRIQAEAGELYDLFVQDGLSHPRPGGSQAARQAFLQHVAQGTTDVTLMEAAAPEIRTNVPVKASQRSAEEQLLYEEENRARCDWQLRSGSQVWLLTSQTPPYLVQLIMRDLDYFMRHSGCRLLIYTSTLCVAADIRTPIDAVFLHCANSGSLSGFGPVFRYLDQMMLRARVVRDPTVRVYLGEGGVPAPVGRCDDAAFKGDPWRHCEVFKALDQGYLVKERQMFALAQQTDFSAISDCHEWTMGADEYGEYSLQAPSSQRYRLLSKLVEIERSNGAGFWDLMAREYPVVVEFSMSHEELAQLLEASRAEGSAEVLPEGGAARSVQELKQERKARATESLITALDYDLANRKQDPAEELREREDRKAPTNPEKEYESVLSLLAQFPGYNNDSSVDSERRAADLQCLKKAAPLLHRRAIALGTYAEAQQLLSHKLEGPTQENRKKRKDCNQLFGTTENAVALYEAARQIAGVLGRASFRELVESAEQVTYRLEDLAPHKEKWQEALRTLSLGRSGVRDPQRIERHENVKRGVNAVLSEFGYELAAASKKKRTGKGEKRQQVSDYLVRPKKLVVDWLDCHRSAQQPPNKRQRVV